MNTLRRPRTRHDWQMYTLGALCVLFLAALVLACVQFVQMDAELQRLRDMTAPAEATGTGGAEVPIPQTSVVEPADLRTDLWTFPIAPEDYQCPTSPFGYRISPLLDVEMYHTGLDIAAAWHAQVVAVADGTVVEHWPPPDGYWQGHPTYGGMVRIEHDNGMQTLYAHLSWSRVHTGDRVRAGQVIGRIGDTGMSDGEHLHLGVFNADGEPENPLLYVEVPR